MFYFLQALLAELEIQENKVVRVSREPLDELAQEVRKVFVVILGHQGKQEIRDQKERKGIQGCLDHVLVAPKKQSQPSLWPSQKVTPKNDYLLNLIKSS